MSLANHSSASVHRYAVTEVLPYLSETEIQQLRKEVGETLNVELSHQAALEVALPRLLESCDGEARDIRTTMKTMVSAQIADGQGAAQLVRANYEHVQQLQELFIKQGKLIEGLGEEGLPSKQLVRLKVLRDNVRSVIEWSRALKEVRHSNLYELVRQHQFRNIYSRIRRLRLIRNTVQSKSGARTVSYQAVFEPFFSKLDAVASMLVAELLGVLRADTVMVSIQKALEEVPESSVLVDDFAAFKALRECIEVCGEELGDAPALLHADGSRCITTEVMRSAVVESVRELWDEQILMDVVDPVQQLSVLLEQMKKVEPVLEALELILVPFSTSFPFFKTVVVAIHAEVVQVLERFVANVQRISVKELMEASAFAQWYKDSLQRCNFAHYVPTQALDSYSATFTTTAVRGLSDHLIHLARACARNIMNLQVGPTMSSSGHPITTGPVDVFAVLQQTIDGLSSTLELPVMRQVGRACAEAMLAYLSLCREMSDYDYWEDELSKKSNNARGGGAAAAQVAADWPQQRMLYLYAFCNDVGAMEEELDSIERKFDGCWGDESATTTTTEPSPFVEVQDALADAAIFYLDEINVQVERVVSGEWGLIFRPGAWYSASTNPLELILGTMAEYVEEEFRVMLPEQRQRRILRQMLAHFVIKYLSTLMIFLSDVIRKPKKFAVDSWNNFIDAVSRDVELSRQLWKQHMSHVGTQPLDAAMKALLLAKDLLSVRKVVDLDFLLHDRLLMDFGDCPTFAIRFTIDARKTEMPSEVRAKMMATWMEKIAHQRRDGLDRPTQGWNQTRSLWGSLDVSMDQLTNAHGIFSTSEKKKRIAAAAEKAQAEKEAKRADRERRAAHTNTGATTNNNNNGQQPVNRLKQQLHKEVEVERLEDVLGRKA